MSKTIEIAPVHKTVVVSATQAHAFDVFINGIDRWWPKAHNVGSAPVDKVVIEPRQGGRWYSAHSDGSEAVNGHIQIWDPPHRAVFSWEISARWKPDPKVASEVEVRFIAESPTRTRVELEHRKFEALGAEGGQAMRGAVNGGWPGLLELFKTEAEA